MFFESQTTSQDNSCKEFEADVPYSEVLNGPRLASIQQVVSEKNNF